MIERPLTVLAVGVYNHPAPQPLLLKGRYAPVFTWLAPISARHLPPLVVEDGLGQGGNSVNGRGKLIKERLGIVFCRKIVASYNQERDVCGTRESVPSGASAGRSLLSLHAAPAGSVGQEAGWRGAGASRPGGPEIPQRSSRAGVPRTRVTFTSGRVTPDQAATILFLIDSQ